MASEGHPLEEVSDSEVKFSFSSNLNLHAYLPDHFVFIQLIFDFCAK
ncbi:MAG: hypothetical protein ACI9D1_001928 [Cryomorphaceae bacterium]|jgi:hypothetical protein